MSYFSQFTSGGFVGEIVAAPSGTWQANPTVNGQEYLKTGNVKTYTSTYAALAANFPTATAQNSNSPVTSSNFVTTDTAYQYGAVGAKLEQDSTHFYFVWQYAAQNTTPQGKGVYYGPTLTTAYSNTYGAQNSSIYDSITFNNQALWSYFAPLYGGAGYIIRGNGGSPTTVISSLPGYKMFAATTGASLCVAVGTETADTTSGFIHTSTNGTSFTARTASTSMGGVVARLGYSQTGGTFIYVTNSGNIYTATDGYTLTSRTKPSGMPNPSQTYGNSNYHGSSPTVALISIGGGTTAAGPYLLRTTDGTSFSLVDLSTVSGLSGAFTGNISPRLIYDGSTSKFVMVNPSTYTFAYSSDGLSWTLDSNKIEATQSKTIFWGINYNGTNLYITIGNSTSTDTPGATPFDFSNKIGGTPNTVGISTAQTFASGSNLSTYIRIA